MTRVNGDSEVTHLYDVEELPPLEQYDVDFPAYQRTFALELNRLAELGYELINVTSHQGRLLGFFRTREESKTLQKTDTFVVPAAARVVGSLLVEGSP